MTAAFAPSNPSKKEWRALEANYGNGLMRTIDVALNMMAASGYTGHTTANFGLAGTYAPGAVGVDPVTKLVPANPVNRVVACAFLRMQA